MVTKVPEAASTARVSEASRKQRRDSLQSSQPSERVMKHLVQRRIATNILEKIGDTMQTTTMVCCWVEGSVLMTILQDKVSCKTVFQAGRTKEGVWSFMSRKCAMSRSAIQCIRRVEKREKLKWQCTWHKATGLSSMHVERILEASHGARIAGRITKCVLISPSIRLNLPIQSTEEVIRTKYKRTIFRIDMP